jgi:hypothetical protein
VNRQMAADCCTAITLIMALVVLGSGMRGCQEMRKYEACIAAAKEPGACK